MVRWSNLFWLNYDLILQKNINYKTEISNRLRIVIGNQLSKTKFFKGKELFFQKSDFDSRSQNEIEDNNENISSQFKNTVPHQIDFTAYGIHRDKPPA